MDILKEGGAPVELQQVSPSWIVDILTSQI